MEVFTASLTAWLIHEACRWEINGSSGIQLIRIIFSNSKVHYSVHKSSSLVPIMSQPNTVNVLPSYFLKIHFNITLYADTWTLQRSVSFKFPKQIPVWFSFLSHTLHIPRPSPSPWFDLPNNICYTVQITRLLTLQSAPATVTSLCSLLRPLLFH